MDMLIAENKRLQKALEDLQTEVAAKLRTARGELGAYTAATVAA